MPEILTFESALDASTPADKLPPGFIQSGSNIDFSIEPGACRVRRGSVLQATIDGATPVRAFFRHLTDPGLTTSPTYAILAGNVYRSTDGTTYASISSIDASADIATSAYKQYAFIAGGSTRIKDSGSATFEWGVQTPTSAPTIVISTLSPLTVTSTWTVVEGTGTGAQVGTATATCDEISLRCRFDAVNITPTLNVNSSQTIGDYGIDYLQIYFSEPKLVTRISRDYSIGDANFTNYWHSELDVEQGFDALPSASTLIDAQLEVTSGTGVSVDARSLARSRQRQDARPPQERVSAAKEVYNVWAVARTSFELIGSSPTGGWNDIQASRIIVEALGPIEVRIRNWTVGGAESYPLNDPNIGYSWWESWARLDSGGAIEWESALSPASARTKTTGGRASVTLVGTPTGSAHGFTHRLIYRQGGYIPAPYRVGTFTGTATGGTFTDTFSDVQVLIKNQPATTDLLSATPSNIVAISEPFYDRLFVGIANKLRWTNPGNPHAFSALSDLTVSHAGDVIKQLHVWPPGLVIVNRDSVYELTGSAFEGRSANYILQRTGSRHGAFAPRACIKTEFGILLLNQDGFFMYVPGQGVDTPILWANAKLAPVFQGAGAADPAALDGSRVPAANLGYLKESIAAYREGKIYIGIPTGTSTTPNTLFVLDFTTKRVWYYTYPWSFSSIIWDTQDNKILIGGTSGHIYRAEIGVNDTIASGTVGTGTSIPYSAHTRSWSTPADTVLENISVEYRGGNGALVKGFYDGGTGTTVGTLTGTPRTWLTPALGGTISNNVAFSVSGSQSDNPTTIYNIAFDALQEPVRVKFYRTPHDTNNYDGEKQWDTHYADMEIIGTATVLGTVLIDNTAVMTATFVGPPGGRQIFPTSFPIDSFGDVAHTIYNAQGTGLFKLWNTKREARNLPPRVNSWQSDMQSLEESICDAFDVDINPNGTVFGTCFIDNSSVAVGTFTGTRRQSFTQTLPVEGYGRTIYVNYSGTAFQHYKTWFHLRPEPDRWTSFVTDKESTEEAIMDSVDSDIHPLGGTVLATAFVDGTAISTSTLTGATRQSFTASYPAETYGRTAWMVYNVSGGGKFKHYRTWIHRRVEPDRVSSFVTDRVSGEEQFWDAFDSDLDPLSGTVLGTVFIDNVAVMTATFTGTAGRQSFSNALPADIYGRTFYVKYSITTGRFKHYNTWHHAQPEPDRLTLVQWGPKTFPSTNIIKTWVPELNPLGTATGTLFVNGTAVSTSTFTGTRRQTFNIGLPNITTGGDVDAIYTSSAKLKHYNTNIETEPKPFSKTSWLVSYKKVGGASQLDTGRFFSLDIEPETGTATITSVWDIDGTAFQTSTLTFTGREWRERLAFAPGAHGYLMQNRLTSSQNFRVWRSNLDLMRVGRKGVSFFSVPGTPEDR